MRGKKQGKTDSAANGEANAPPDASLNKPGPDTNDLRPNPMINPHKANGHAPESALQEDISTFESWAASDDVRGHLAAETAPSAADCANRDACAELAQAESEGKRLRRAGAASRAPNNDGKSSEKAASDTKGAPEIPPGAEPLPLDGASFVEAVHAKVDLIELEVSLLRSEDEKIRQRELAYLRELKYGKSAAFSTDDETPQIIFDDGPSFPNPDSRGPTGD
jgi:hypothetical protein